MADCSIPVAARNNNIIKADNRIKKKEKRGLINTGKENAFKYNGKSKIEANSN